MNALNTSELSQLPQTSIICISVANLPTTVIIIYLIILL